MCYKPKEYCGLVCQLPEENGTCTVGACNLRCANLQAVHELQGRLKPSKYNCIDQERSRHCRGQAFREHTRSLIAQAHQHAVISTAVG